MLSYGYCNAELYSVLYEPGDLTRYEFCFWEYDDRFIIGSLGLSMPNFYEKFRVDNYIPQFLEDEIGLLMKTAECLCPGFEGKYNPHNVVQVAVAIYKTLEKEKQNEV